MKPSTRTAEIREQSVDKFLEQFPKLHAEAMLENLETADSREQVRRFFRRCLDEHSNYWYGYKYLSAKLKIDLEEDLRKKLDAYQPLAPDRYQVDIHDLKLLRRIALERYAFGLAGDIAERLLRQSQKKRVARMRLWFWLKKDIVLPRVPLAMVVGYGVVLGAFKEWLSALGVDWWFTGIFGLTAGVASWFLIYCNVRDSIGDTPGVGGRTFKVFWRCLGWSGFFLVLGRLVAVINAELNSHFDWGAAVSITMASLLVGILVQFFFAKAGSIADPL